MRVFINKYIVKAFVIVFIIQVIGLLLGLASNVLSGYYLDEIAGWILYTGFILQIMLAIIAVIFLIVNVVDTKRTYRWSAAYVLLTIAECIALMFVLPHC